MVGAVLPGIQYAGLVSVGRRGHYQSSGPRYGANKDKGTWGYVGKIPAELGKLASWFPFMRWGGGHNSLITVSLLPYSHSRKLTVVLNNSLTPPRLQAMVRHPHLVLELIWSVQFPVL